MKIYPNINLIISKQDIPTIKQQLNEQIPETIKEFNLYFKTKEPIKIDYELIEHQKGYSCKGLLYFGNTLIREYEPIDLLFYDINEMILKKLLP